MREFTKIMKAFSDPNRVKIIAMLNEKSMCVCELRAALELSQPAVSSHLKVLDEAGLVRSEKDGLWVNYHLTPPPLANGRKLLEQLLEAFSREPEIRKILTMLPTIHRECISRKQP